MEIIYCSIHNSARLTALHRNRRVLMREYKWRWCGSGAAVVRHRRTPTSRMCTRLFHIERNWAIYIVGDQMSSSYSGLNDNNNFDDNDDDKNNHNSNDNNDDDDDNDDDGNNNNSNNASTNTNNKQRIDREWW